jgi:hypothetical protein
MVTLFDSAKCSPARFARSRPASEHACEARQRTPFRVVHRAQARRFATATFLQAIAATYYPPRCACHFRGRGELVDPAATPAREIGARIYFARFFSSCPFSRQKPSKCRCSQMRQSVRNRCVVDRKKVKAARCQCASNACREEVRCGQLGRECWSRLGLLRRDAGRDPRCGRISQLENARSVSSRRRHPHRIGGVGWWVRITECLACSELTRVPA